MTILIFFFQFECKTGNGISFALTLLLVIRLKAINYDYLFLSCMPCSSFHELNSSLSPSLTLRKNIWTNIHDETLKQHFRKSSARVTDKFKMKGRFTNSTKVLSCIFKQLSNNNRFNSKCSEESSFLRSLFIIQNETNFSPSSQDSSRVKSFSSGFEWGYISVDCPPGLARTSSWWERKVSI